MERCEICESTEVDRYRLADEIALRCEDHAVGTSLSAEEVYWNRESNKDQRK